MKEYLKFSGKETEQESIRLILDDFNSRPLSTLSIENNLTNNESEK